MSKLSKMDWICLNALSVREDVDTLLSTENLEDVSESPKREDG